MRRPTRNRRLPLRLRDNATTPKNGTKFIFQSVRVRNSYRGKLVTPGRKKRVFAHTRAPPTVSSHDGECKYPVKCIMRHGINEDGVTMFKLKWSPPDEGTSFEPIESIEHLPLLILKYQKSEELKFWRKCKNAPVGTVCPSRPFQFPKIHDSFETKLHHPAESYVPDGSETIHKILEEIDVENDVKLWLVQFRGHADAHFVNMQRIVYYFPLRAALFLNECTTFSAVNH